MSAQQLRWTAVSKAIPPRDPEHTEWSPEIWLALSDGTVRHGSCLHRPKGATYKAKVHDWFIANTSIGCFDGLKVVAWMPFAVPDHPNALQNEPRKISP